MFRSLLSGVVVILLTASTLPAQDWARNLLPTTEHNFATCTVGFMSFAGKRRGFSYILSMGSRGR